MRSGRMNRRKWRQICVSSFIGDNIDWPTSKGFLIIITIHGWVQNKLKKFKKFQMPKLIFSLHVPFHRSEVCQNRWFDEAHSDSFSYWPLYTLPPSAWYEWRNWEITWTKAAMISCRRVWTSLETIRQFRTRYRVTKDCSGNHQPCLIEL